MEITNNLSEKALYDYKIVRNAIAGDEKAYGELFKRYKDSVYFMILKMVNNRTDAEDLMFEAFEKAFASLNYYSPQFAFSTWLFKIASNNTIDFIRKRKAQTVSLDVDDINPEDRGYIHSIPADVLSLIHIYRLLRSSTGATTNSESCDFVLSSLLFSFDATNIEMIFF